MSSAAPSVFTGQARKWLKQHNLMVAHSVSNVTPTARLSPATSCMTDDMPAQTLTLTQTQTPTPRWDLRSLHQAGPCSFKQSWTGLRRCSGLQDTRDHMYHANGHALGKTRLPHTAYRSGSSRNVWRGQTVGASRQTSRQRRRRRERRRSWCRDS